MTINTLDEDIITWTVPSFPVLDITFRRGVAIIRGNNQHVLFNARRCAHCDRNVSQEKIKKCHLHTHLGRAKVKQLYITARLLQLKYDARCTKMGIKNLLPLLKDVSKKKHLKDFHGETAAIDASCWLHKALSVRLQSLRRR